MKNNITNNKQIDLLDNFKSILELRGTIPKELLDLAVNLFLSTHQTELKNLSERLKNIKVNGKKIVDYEIYNTHISEFQDISKKHIDKFDLVNAFGINLKEIKKIKFADRNHLLQYLSRKMDAEVKQKTERILYFTKEEMDNIIKAAKDYENINEKLKEVKDEALKEYICLHLYKDAYEIYLKVLKEAYSKIIKRKVKDNKEMYDYFDTHYPLLRDSANNLLRNDISHLNYDVRQNFTLEQINEGRTLLLVKALTGIIARIIFINDFFEKSVKKIIKD